MKLDENPKLLKSNLITEQVDNSSGNWNASHQEKTADHMTRGTVAVV